jgi:spore coat polysaccharide biosynthesis protein SpsF
VCRKGHQVYEGTILTPHPAANPPNGMADLSIAFHVLIHINPESLNGAHELLYSLSKKFILISEYFNPVPVATPYRGHENRLLKRNFAGKIWA